MLTARQYGEVVLPDAASGNCPGTRRQASHITVPVQGGYGTCFCRHGTRFDRSRACRGTILNEDGKLSRYRIINESTGAVSRYKDDRSQEFITVQGFYCGHMRVSGCNGHYEFVLGAGAKAKTVTNNLPILSVLAFRYFDLLLSFQSFIQRIENPAFLFSKSLSITP
jgi:hypothetical protein